jgi:hypothetical protein
LIFKGNKPIPKIGTIIVITVFVLTRNYKEFKKYIEAAMDKNFYKRKAPKKQGSCGVDSIVAV